jgi:hypothetical protein
MPERGWVIVACVIGAAAMIGLVAAGVVLIWPSLGNAVFVGAFGAAAMAGLGVTVWCAADEFYARVARTPADGPNADYYDAPRPLT